MFRLLRVIAYSMRIRCSARGIITSFYRLSCRESVPFPIDLGTRNDRFGAEAIATRHLHFAIGVYAMKLIHSLVASTLAGVLLTGMASGPLARRKRSSILR